MLCLLPGAWSGWFTAGKRTCRTSRTPTRRKNTTVEFGRGACSESCLDQKFEPAQRVPERLVPAADSGISLTTILANNIHMVHVRPQTSIQRRGHVRALSRTVHRLTHLKQKHHQRTWDMTTPHGHGEQRQQNDGAQQPHVETTQLSFGLCWCRRLGTLASSWLGLRLRLAWRGCVLSHLSNARRLTVWF